MFTSDVSRYHITYHLNNELGEALFSFTNHNSIGLKFGKNKITCVFPKNFFQSGSYHLSLFVIEDVKNAITVEKDIFSYTVVDGGRELGVYMGREPGYIRPTFEWKNNL
jgi:lipopolysaccharide transport system ATP-binding protein